MEALSNLSEAPSVLDGVAGRLNAQHGRLVAVVEWLLDDMDECQGDGLWTADCGRRKPS